MSDFNINPVHLDFKSAGSDSTHTSLSSPYQDNNKGFQSFTSEGSDSTHTSLNSSGFQYLLGSTSLASATETLPFNESVSTIITETVTEFLHTYESASTIPEKVVDSAPMAEFVSTIITETVEEYLLISESATGTPFTSALDRAFFAESVSTVQTETIPEPIHFSESVTTINRYTAKFTTYFRGLVRAAIPFTTEFKTLQRLTSQFTTYFNGLQNQLAGVTATGTGPLGDANPIGPNVSVNGTTIIGTTPAGAANTLVYVDVPATATYVDPLSPLDWGDLYSFAMNLDYAGGSFAISSVPLIGVTGTVMKLFGLNAYITDSGRRYSNSMKGYVTSGVFGAPLLNKQFRLISNSSSLIQGLNFQASTVYTNPSGPQTNTLTARTIAKAVANLCGINLTWVPTNPYDVPVTDFAYEPTMNGFSALNSLAARVGATLRWFGNNNYYIADPNFSIGLFEVPRPQLIAAGGIEQFQHYDLETGIGGAVPMNSFGSPLQYFYTARRPQWPFSIGQQGTYYLPSSVTNPQVAQGYPSPLIPVVSLTKQLTSDDPPVIHPLPQNYRDVMIQILVPTTYAVGTTQYMTTDSSFYDTFVAPQLGSGGTQLTQFGVPASEYIFTLNQGGAYVPHIKIDANVFPDHPAISNGNFIMNIACTTKPISPSQNNNQTIPPTWVQTYRGTINCIFYGVMPLPGMWGRATLDDLTVEGVIERVSFTPPGFLQLEVAQYARINWVQPPIQVTAS